MLNCVQTKLRPLSSDRIKFQSGSWSMHKAYRIAPKNNNTKPYRGILADVIVYIFAHLHTALLAEGNMLDINWLQEVNVLVKFNTCWNIWLFLSNIQGKIVFQKLQNLWVAKVLMSSYILCKILSFQARVAQEVFNISGWYSLAELIILWTFNI